MTSGQTRRPWSIEWPTIAIAATIWSGFAAVLTWHERLPVAVTVLAFAVLGAWYMSLQHEAVHGHPTPSGIANRVIAGIPLHVWLPFAVYEESHLLHHDVELTMPGVDPESFLMSAEQWERAGRFRRTLVRANFTLIGRLVLGPVIGIPMSLWAEARRLADRPSLMMMWLRHLIGVSAVLWVVIAVAGVPTWQFLLGFCYVGLSLTYLRSFAEHRAVAAPGSRSAIVRSGRCFGTLFLFNNLHHAHHAAPGVAWYQLPQLVDELGSESQAAAGAGCYRGYAELFRRYAVRPISSPISISADRASATR